MESHLPSEDKRKGRLFKGPEDSTWPCLFYKGIAGIDSQVRKPTMDVHPPPKEAGDVQGLSQDPVDAMISDSCGDNNLQASVISPSAPCQVWEQQTARIHAHSHFHGVRKYSISTTKQSAGEMRIWLQAHDDVDPSLRSSLREPYQEPCFIETPPASPWARPKKKTRDSKSRSMIRRIKIWSRTTSKQDYIANTR